MLSPLLKIMQLTCTVCVGSLNTHNDGQGKRYRSCQKHKALSMCDVVFFLTNTCCHLLGILFVTSQKSNLCTHRTLQKITVLSLTCTKQGRTSAQFILTGIHWLVVTNKGWLTFPTQTIAKVTRKFHSQ
jgi:hypothetical protein